MNKKDFSVSVAMAAYNGEHYIEAQIQSILSQLRPEDELVISLDPSSDRTEEIIRSFAGKDRRVRLIRGLGEGLISNFENAIRHCKKDILFLSDQDDVWKEGKVDSVLECFRDPSVSVVMHDAQIVDEEGVCIEPSFMKKRGCRKGVLQNLIKNSYIGCCMAFRKEMRKFVLPFPKDLPMHDQWIGLVGEITGKTKILEKPLICYRRHGHNASADSHAGFRQMLTWRVCIFRDILKFAVKYKRYKGRNKK
ncbi:MAG: glycosyltransferase family 2 protein [Frisingicoccus sp.]|nr:glycosyltransferase family 2 protein [Frisingicoccus sp.]